MVLRGDLASVDLAQVFQMLALNRQVGLLSIQSRQSSKVLAFDRRGVTVHHNLNAVLDRVVASFVRSHRLSEEAFEEVRDHASRMGQPLTDSLLAGGYLEPDALEAQYRIELEEEIYSLFFSRDARFEFYENAEQIDGFDGTTDERFFFNCDSIVMEAARRIDEWDYIVDRVPSTDTFYAAEADSVSEEEFGLDGAVLFELLDGCRSVERVIEITGLPNFPACKVISQMLDAGALVPVADEDLVELAIGCVNDDRVEDAINLFERAVTVGRGGAEVHALVASAYRSVQCYEDAARHLEAEAQLLVEDGYHADAAARLLEVREMLPTSLGARERLVTLTVEGDIELDGFEPMAEGKEVVDLLLAFGDIERVRRLLELLLLVAPGDIDLKKALVSVHIKAGDQQRIVDLYESIAEDLVEAGHPLEAIGYLQKILLMDRERSDISERVRVLYERDERSRRRSRSLGVLAGLFGVFLLLAVSYWFYNEHAKVVFERIDVRNMLEHEDFAGAAITFQDFISSYPLTAAVESAEEQLQQVEAAWRRFEARRETERLARTRELERIRAEYQRGWERHRELFFSGEPEESQRVLARVRELIASAGRQADLEWALEQRVEHTWQRLEDYLATAAALGARYDEARDRADWRTVRQVALQLADDYANTAVTARAHVPVMVRTRPAGARLLHLGKPLTHVADGISQPLTTPAMVFCPDAASMFELTVELDGFEARQVSIDPRGDPVIEAVLGVVPQHRISWPDKIQTGIGLGAGWIAVGLRGGRLGVGRIDGSDAQLIDLPGLKAVDGTPMVRGGRVFFATNENTIESVVLGSGEPTPGWPVRLEHGIATGLMVDDGRVAVVDGESVLHCWEQSTGAHLWSLSLDSRASGVPAIRGRQIVVGTVDGRVFVLDAANGRVRRVLRTAEGISTGIYADGANIVFGCADGSVSVVDPDSSRVLWSEQFDVAVEDGTIACGRDRICVAADGRISFRVRRTGEELGSIPVDGVVHGMTVQGGRLLVGLRRAQDRNAGVRGVLQAIDIESRTVLWEFKAQSVALGAFGVDDLAVAFVDAEDEVVVFR